MKKNLELILGNFMKIWQISGKKEGIFEIDSVNITRKTEDILNKFLQDLVKVWKNFENTFRVHTPRI